MKEKEFDFVIYPLKLIITIGLDYKTLCDRFENAEAAMSVCQHCNMSLGFKVGEDEHAAYIAGFVGNCAGEMFGFLEEEKDGKEN